MGYLMKSGLASVANILVNILQWLAIVVVAASPLWIIDIIVIIVVRRKKRKDSSRQPQQQVDKPSGQPPAAPDMTRQINSQHD